MSPEMTFPTPDRRNAIDWRSFRTNEDLERAMVGVMEEIALPQEDIQAMSPEEVKEYYKNKIKAKGYPYGFRLDVTETGDAGQKSVKGFSASPFDERIIYFWDK